MFQTLVCQFEIEGDMQAGTESDGFLILEADGWNANIQASEADNYSVHHFASYQGQTQGSPIALTSAAYTASSAPTAAGTGVGLEPVASLDPSTNAQTAYRMISAGVEVWSESVESETSGNVTVMSTIRPLAAAGSGGLSGMTNANLFTASKEIVSVKQEPATALIGGKCLRAVCLPNSPASFIPVFMCDSGTAAQFPVAPNVLVMLSGAQADQELHYRVTWNYEFEYQSNHIVGLAPSRPTYVAPERSFNIMPHLVASATSLGDVARDDYDGTGTKTYFGALEPEKAKAVIQHVAQKVKLGVLGGTEGSGLSLIERGLKSVAGSGILQAIPFVGNYLHTAAKSFFGL
jgi:hypothetical protein